MMALPPLVAEDVRFSDVRTAMLREVKPAELPIERPIRFQLAINLRTAKAHLALRLRAMKGFQRILLQPDTGRVEGTAD